MDGNVKSAASLCRRVARTVIDTVAGWWLKPRTVYAADGDMWVLGYGNGSDGETQLTRNGAGTNTALVVVNSSGHGLGGYGSGVHSGVLAGSTSGPGVRGESVNDRGVLGTSTASTGVHGSSDGTYGVVGTAPKAGVYGTAKRNDGYGVYGITAGTGVRGHGSTGMHGTSSATELGWGAGVLGECPAGAGVLGDSPDGSGVHGRSTNGVGVSGLGRRQAGVRGVASGAPGVEGFAMIGPGPGVSGIGETAPGVRGQSDSSYGVHGGSRLGVGVRGHSDSYHGILGSTNSGYAGSFIGPVIIWGSLTVAGSPKSAVVPHPDGSHRRLYCTESPESWLEDFGNGELVDGIANVSLESDFAQIVRADDYHVFLTPYGDSNGLYVSRRMPNGFEVREQRQGTSRLPFGYRVVARRADVSTPRLEHFVDAEPIGFEATPPMDIPLFEEPRVTSVEPDELPEPPTPSPSPDRP
jgi:hypothetical protein